MITLRPIKAGTPMGLPRIYDTSVFDTSKPVESWWEASAPPFRKNFARLDRSVTCDVAIIGAGFTGLNAALALARDHGLDVRVLEAGHIGWGASGRNGGFCANPGTKLSWTEVASRYGRDEAIKLNTAQEEAIAHVRSVLDRYGIDAETHSDRGELCLAHTREEAEVLPDEAKVIEDLFGRKPTLYRKEELRQLGADSPDFHGGMLLPWGFALHPLRYLRGLADAAADAGVALHPHSEVTGVALNDGSHRLRTANGEIWAKHLIVATNGYTAETIPPWIAGRLLPAMSSILVTRPLTDDEQAAQGWTCDLMAYDTRSLLHYFRKLPDGRFLFGGRGGVSGKPASRAKFLKRLRQQFDEMFPALRDVETTHQWSGHVCITRKRAPFVGTINGHETAWAGLAFHGSGVAMGSWTGRTLAGLVAGTETTADLPAVMRDAPPKFLFPALRPLYLSAVYALYQRHDG
ncbi:MAG: FAD-binding oxidoreductase [Pseudomonadota bacterium]